jgi:hypothetical protein
MVHVQVFHLPINAAAKALSIGVTALKKYCRREGIKRWPYRKMESMAKIAAAVGVEDLAARSRASQATGDLQPVLQEIR